jgi:hypothetical protein
VNVTENNIPVRYKLSQNYPNPFNPVTTISYSIAKNSVVKLCVYDLLGREIKSLVNEYQNSGDYQVIFNAVDLPSGIYFYRIKAGDYFETKKMILIK